MRLEEKKQREEMGKKINNNNNTKTTKGKSQLQKICNETEKCSEEPILEIQPILPSPDRKPKFTLGFLCCFLL